MTEDAASEIRTQILNRSLDEIRRHAKEEPDKPDHEPPQSGGSADAHDADPCVICLEPVSEPASARPCGHRNFDLSCLLSWLEQRERCPLCNADIRTVEYPDPNGSAPGASIRSIDIGKEPNEQATSNNDSVASSNQRALREAFSRRNRRRHPRPERSRHAERPNAALLRRRDVYRHRLYSLHVGSNRISAYRDLVPADFTTNSSQVTRARTWIRRELEAFSFLQNQDSVTQTRRQQPSSSSSSPALTTTTTSTSHLSSPTRQTPAPRHQQRPASNAHFLLEYIIAILKTVDVRDSSGHAENLVAEFLGRDNARLFLHELNSFLRSPYESPEAWDRHVQYPPRVAVSDAQRRRRDGGALGEEEWSRKRTSEGAAVGNGESMVERRMRARRAGGRFLDRHVPD